jgi:predicted AlkP superfamily pyrophosphatase or phosphodiesterase
MKYKLTPHQYQKLQNMIYNVIEDIMPEHINVEYVDGFDDYDDLNEVPDINQIDSVSFYDDESYEILFKIRIRSLYNDDTGPKIVVEYFIQEKLDALFGEGRWHEQLIKWIEYNHPEVTTLYDKIKSVV